MIKHNGCSKVRYAFAVAILMLAANAPLPVKAAMYWAPAKQAGHAHHGGAKSFALIAETPAAVSLIDPLLKAHPLQLHQQMVAIKPTGMGNYHALVATRENPMSTESAVRYVYMYGKPSGASPSALTSLEKGRLEIEPKPLAREHRRYHSGDTAHFFVRFNGKALVFRDVQLTTAHGSVATLKTDSQGMLAVNLPEDFPAIKAGLQANQPADFVLSVQHEVDGHVYAATFSSDYHVNPSHWQSTGWGVITILVGMIMGIFITVRMRKGRA